MKQLSYFAELPEKATFSRNGNLWLKRSSRTAEIVQPECYAGTWFYFAQKDLCIVGLHSRISRGYNER